MDTPQAAFSKALEVTVEKDDMDSGYRGIMRRLHEDKEDLLASGLVRIEAPTVEVLRDRAEEWLRVVREAGLEADLAWDTKRVVRTADGYGISLRASRPELWQG